jgi:beta-lactamase class D
MKKILLLLFCFLVTTNSLAITINPPKSLLPNTACFILFDLTKNKIITEYNPSRCKEKVPPDSTFKIPLSLMAFDQQLITQKTIFKWDGEEKGLPNWNQNQTPQTWLQYSVVWVSRELTPKIGLPKIQNYLKQFDYGNQDFAGDPAKNNGLTNAWLSSSLRISADEQIIFLKKLIMNELPVSKTAMADTKANMYVETSLNGWKLYGKTGAGNNVQQSTLSDGWFIGYTQKGKKTYVFALHFTDSIAPFTGGILAKDYTRRILKQEGIF